MKEALEKQAPMMKPDARTSKERDFQAKVRDYQRWLEDNQKESNKKGWRWSERLSRASKK